MAQDESAALGGALQAAWCDSPGRGSGPGARRAVRAERVRGGVDPLRAGPQPRAALYRKRQKFQDRLCGDLRGAFEAR